MLGRLLVGTLGVLLVACHDIEHPTWPLPVPTPQAAPTRIVIVIAPPELPPGGGTATVFISTIAGDGIVVAPRVRVEVSALNGTLSASSVTTDATGHAQVEWTSTSSGTVTATAGDLVTSAAIRVLEPTVPLLRTNPLSVASR